MALASTTVVLLACGPFPRMLATVSRLWPADSAAYRRGELGVVRPRFARRPLVEAYRTLTGQPAVAGVEPASTVAGARSPLDAWIAARDAALGSPPPDPDTYRSALRFIGNYQYIDNCTDGAFANAVRTLSARTERFGPASPQVVDWTRAQVAVFRNCGDSPLVLPEPAPANADRIVHADRTYQTAAAYFYAMQYEEAARRFREIADDRSSPWRPQGRYLAARALIRRATVPAQEKREIDRFLTEAEIELNAVVADADSAPMHGPAQRLLEFVAARLHPIDRLHRVSRELASAAAPAERALDDYRLLMDRLVGDTVDYSYDRVANLDDMRRDDDLTDWIMSMQGGGREGAARAIAQWQHTQAIHWLVAALWNVPANDPALPSLLAAAARVDRASPAVPTLAFVRVRALIQAERTAEARSLLATLPTRPRSGFAVETVNLLEGERLMLARTFGEFLLHAPRSIVEPVFESLRGANNVLESRRRTGLVTFDEDSSIVLNQRLPLDRLVAAATQPILPDRLRRRVAVAAFTRALLLHRDAAARAVGPALSALAPQVRSDVDRYVAASTDADRRFAGLLLLLRTPGMVTRVSGPDDDYSMPVVEPVRAFDHLLRRTWWCGNETGPPGDADRPSELIGLLYPSRDLPYPAFVTAAERATTERELAALRALGPARSYLAQETIRWARARPGDPDVPEALALVIEGWRWNCGDDDKWQLAREAFTILHRRYPQSDWAKKTRYWYR